jgi:hypothetical protein
MIPFARLRIHRKLIDDGVVLRASLTVAATIFLILSNESTHGVYCPFNTLKTLGYYCAEPKDPNPSASSKEAIPFGPRFVSGISGG